MSNVNIRLLAASLIAGAAVAAHADIYIGSYAGQSYFLTSQAGGWTALESYAQSLGTHLVSVHSLTEQNIISAGVAANASSTPFVWIGFTDQVTENDFQWSDGSAVDFTFWSGGEPNDANGEDYTVINWAAGGEWNDLPDNFYNSQGVYALPGVPGPAALASFATGALATLRRRRRKG